MSLYGELRGFELRIAEEMASLLDYVSRVVKGLESADWYYVNDKLYALINAAQRLQRAVDDERQQPANQAARPAALDAVITRLSRHYVAGRALYPRRGGRRP